VPLSEHEQRLLDQIERALYAEDPKFASSVRSTDLRSHLRRRIKRMSAVFVLGFAVLVAGIVVRPSRPVVSIGGFVIMVAAGWLIARSWLKLSGRLSDVPRLNFDRPGSPAEGGWRARFEDRWRRRFDDRDY
jgi:hypothetical protein